MFGRDKKSKKMKVNSAYRPLCLHARYECLYVQLPYTDTHNFIGWVLYVRYRTSGREIFDLCLN